MILVTGATGNVGRELVPLLLEAGQQVRVLTRDVRKVEHLLPHVEIAEGDLDRPESLAPAMRGVSRVYLLAHGAQQANALDAAKGAGVRHIVKMSTLQTGVTPILGAGRAHYLLEEELRRSGLGWTFLRPTMFNGNTVWWFAHQIKTTGVVRFPGGSGRVSPIDAYDIAAVAAAALTQEGHEGQAYALTGPELHTMGELVHVLADVLQSPIQYEDIPVEALVEQMRKGGRPEDLLAMMEETLTGIRTNRFAMISEDVERVTGRRPRTFVEWARANVASFQ